MKSMSVLGKSVFSKLGAQVASVSVFALSLPFVAGAQDAGLEAAASVGLSTASLPVIVGRIIYAFLGLLGVILVVLIIYAGFLWMTAQGNDEQIKKAKQVITNAVIGLAIILSAWAITAWIINALTEATRGASGSSQDDRWYDLTSGPRGSPLGNGIIEYHYPEPAQADVPRNTKISITFKKPLVLSTVFRNYDDKGTYTTTDDLLCAGAAPCETGTPVTAETVLELNVENVRVTPVTGLRDSGTGSIDERFSRRYPAETSLTEPAPTAKVTAVTAAFTVPQMQSLVLRPLTLLGSPSGPMNYRVALRGGDTGIKVWEDTGNPAEPDIISAFEREYPDGGYYWLFETGTTIDVTPPKIDTVIPLTTVTPGQPDSSVLDRNQLLQIYFDEAVDPTTASGILGAGGGFGLIDISAQCLPGTYPGTCSWNGGQPGTVPGKLALGNRYRTAEFTPSDPCDGQFIENSCGEQVFCLPRNVELRVTAVAAEIDTVLPIEPAPPTASVDNGVEDMVGNSMDGNGDGVAQGQQSAPAGSQDNGRPDAYDLNTAPVVATNMSDTATWRYHVGSNIDLTVPVVKVLDPPALPSDADYEDGASHVPVDLTIGMVWSKIMSVTSLRTGTFDEKLARFPDPYSTVVLRSRECQKTSNQVCVDAQSCECARIAPPGYFLGVSLVTGENGVGVVSRVDMLHPAAPFRTANDLGYSDEELLLATANVPVYVPIARAKLRDDKQNCFWPSRYEPTDGSTACTLDGGEYSCCVDEGVSDGAFPSVCAPLP